ncbi:MAG: HEAT repeat domain-containing protein, partial [Blastocatellia bacterium]|nr:HEAT repeat domain-containing protein [Blastocatellia bacterium]
MYRMLPQRGQRVLIPILILLSFSHALAQSSARADREARWASLQLPTGKFTRFVDKAKGISFRVPADWAQQPGRRGGTIFKGSQETANVILVIDNIPDGLGVAAYVSSFLQSIRNEPIKPESTIVRRVSFSGLEWREVTYEFARDGDTMRQVLWFTASGPRAYGLILTASPDQIDKFEPIFKRIVSSTHIGAAGHWDEEYENLRANFTSGANSEVDQEKETAAVTESLRGGALSIEMATDRIAQLFASSPETAIDLITDPDPQVRTAAIMGIAKSSDPKIIDLMVWALADQDLIASTAAAHTLAAIVANGALPIAIKSKLAALAENPAAIVRAGAAMNEAAARE